MMKHLDSSVLEWRACKYCIDQAILYRSSSIHFSEYQYEPEDKRWIQLQINLQHIPVNTTKSLKIMIDLTDTSTSTHYESEDDDGVKTSHN